MVKRHSNDEKCESNNEIQENVKRENIRRENVNVKCENGQGEHQRQM